MPRRMGADVWSDRYRKHAHRTFREAATRYLEEFDGKDPKRQALAAESLLPYIGNLPLIDVDDETLGPFKVDRRKGQGAFKRPAMAGTVNKELTFVVTVLNRACKHWRWIPSVPAVRHVKGPKREPYPITWEEQDKWFRKLPDGWSQGAALFAINTGVRKDELFGLRWRDMVKIPELDSFVFILADTKNGKDRAVICNSIARKVIGHMRTMRKEWRRERAYLLAELEAGKYDHAPTIKLRLTRRCRNIQRRLTSGLVFPSRTGKRISSVAKIVNKAWLEAGLPNQQLVKKGVHNWRHSFGARLRAAGVSAEDRDALLGHSNKSLSQHYALPDIEYLQGKAELVVQRRETTVLRVVRSVP